jgi:5'-nucleotidase
MLVSLAAVLALLAPADSVLLRVLAIGDFHGALEPRVDPRSGRLQGGIAALKTTMDALAADCRCPVLRLDAGDQMQGTLASNLVFGRSAVEALNLLGVDAAALGNHDLDWGIDTLGARMAEARYAWLAANVLDSAAGGRPRWIRPSRVLTVGPLRVGLVGYANSRTRQMVFADRVPGLAFLRGRAPIADQLRQLHDEGVDLTILVSHEGAFCDSLACAGEIVELAAELDTAEVQLIIAGHTHTVITTTVRGIPILSARANGTAVGVADLVARLDGSRGWRLRVEEVFADRVPGDSAGLALAARYRPEAERRAREVVAVIGDSLLTGAGEYPLGNLIADAQRAAAGADLGLMNSGGIRRSLLPGPVTYGDLYELHPFGNEVVMVRVTGEQLRSIVEFTVSRGGGLPRFHVSGLQVRYDPAAEAGRRVVELRGADGRQIAPARRYTLALPNFLAAGGEGLPVVAGLSAAPVGKTDLEAMREHLRRLPQPVRGPTDRRYLPVDR